MNIIHLNVAATIFTFLIAASFINATGIFNEELLIKDLGHGYVGLHFNFVSRSPEFEHPVTHYDLIPKSMLDLMTKYSTDELHLSLVRGFWDDDRWGSNFVAAAPTGAELWAWFKHNTPNVDQSWFELTHALSGQFCASLNRLSGKAHSVVPRWSYRPTGLVNSTGTPDDSLLLRYAQMPGESLCSENFTPWMKLLPCKNVKGLASLLVPTSLFLSNYKALTLTLRRVCWDLSCTHLGFELSQTLTVVFDRRFIYGLPDKIWSVQGLLRSQFRGTCTVAQSSRVFVLDGTTPTETIPSFAKSLSTDPRIQAAFASDAFFNGNSSMKFTVDLRTEQIRLKPTISVSRYVTGSGTTDGGIRVLLSNNADFDLTLVYMEPLPWCTQVLFSSVKISTRRSQSSRWISTKPVQFHLVPSMSRERMGLLELVLSLPSKYDIAISYKFRRVLQRWDEYPPDANRGYPLPAASISYLISRAQLARLRADGYTVHGELTLPVWAGTYGQLFNQSSTTQYRTGDGFVRLHTPVLLITMPTPDFSMPFNALCIVCSVVTLLFGSVHKVTADRLYAKLPPEGGSKLHRLIGKLHDRFSRQKEGVKDKLE